MRSLVYALILLLISHAPVQADELREVEKMLKSRIDGVISVLQNKKLGKPEKNARIIELVDPVFDFELMARLSLGKKHWPDLNSRQQQQFVELFVQRIKESYLEKMDLYTDEKVVYESPKKVNDRIHMPTYLVSKDNRYSMLYKLYQSKGSWKIYDLEIQGVSVIQTYRSQFDGVLRSGTVADLLEKMKAPGQFSIETDKN
jgi:phospholipid transport system substrate-binding protein